MGAIRTQIYLTPEQRKRLDTLRKIHHKTLAQVVREAIDAYIGAPATADAQRILDESFGTLPNLKVPPRSEWRKRERRLGWRVRSADR